MSTTICVELKDLKLQTKIGTYEPDGIIPKQHLLDLTLWIDPNKALVFTDSMENVFDYDPLLLDINRLAVDRHYETQEGLITKIIEACSNYSEIKSIDICLKKLPVSAGTGSIGIRVSVDTTAINGLRNTSSSA